MTEPTRHRLPPSPSVDDVLIAAETLDWPALQSDGIEITEGEDAWRTAVTEQTARAIWDALGGAGDDRGGRLPNGRRAY
jgi:hypothetical protein